MHEKTSPDVGEESVTHLRGEWRAAERDTAAAEAAAAVAALALAAADEADKAAAEATMAANAAHEAARRAQSAADAARKAAGKVSDASLMHSASAEGDRVRADQAVLEAKRAEHAARERFHEAQGTRSPKAES